MLLRAARQRTPSRRAPGQCMSPSELAEAVCAWLWETTHVRYELDGHYIAKLERGTVRWPNDAYRSGLRHVLAAVTDADLGFRSTRRNTSARTVTTAELPSRTVATVADPDQAEVVLMGAADESAQFISLAEASNVGELTVEQMHVDVRRIARNYLKVPTLPLFARTRALRDRAFTLLSGRQRPPQTRELYAAAGWALTVLAWMSVDLGRPDTAEVHARTAWACADNADHDGLRAWVRATQHTAAFWQNDWQRADDYAADGLRYATGTASAFLASAHALDLARGGRGDRARDVLVHAQRAAETSDTTADELAGPFTCSAERAEGLWSDTQLCLGMPEVTLVHADRAVATFDATPGEARNVGSERMVRLQQVKAHLALGQLDGAAQALAPVLTTAPEHRVRPLLHRMTEVWTDLAAPPFTAERLAAGMREGIVEFGRHPVVAELTTDPRGYTSE